nr:DUF3592 domain-containing protein [Haloferula luteola]
MRSNRARTAGAVRRKSPVRKDRGVRVVAWATSVIGIVWVISFSGKWQEALNARSWVKTPAEVIWSRVREQDSDDGTTYSVDIFYRYTYEGQEYRSNRRRLISSSSSGRASKQAEVDAHPPGQAISCWVDPGHPDRAVLERGWVFHGVMAAVAVAILLTSMGCWWRVLGGPSDGDASRRLRENENRKGLGREVRDGSLRRRWTSLTVALLTAGFWNGLVSVFVGVAWKAWKGGNPEWFLMLFLIPFVGIGIFLLGAVVVQGVALFSPRYGVELEKVSLRPGEDTALQWMRTGGVGTPRRLRIWLVGREEATYQRGSSTTTARETFFEQELFATEAPLRMREGRLTVTIPAGGMPSLRTPHNKLRWFAVLGVETPRMPAVLDEYEIDVVP